jgi:hypothetical protein
MDGGKVHWSYWEQRHRYFSGSTSQLPAIVPAGQGTGSWNRPESRSSTPNVDAAAAMSGMQKVKDGDTLSAAASDEVAD